MLNYLNRVRLAGVDSHANPETLEQHLAGVIWALLLAALGMEQQLRGPWQRQQAMLHIQCPCDCIDWIMECHCECVTLCCDLHMTTELLG